MRLQMHATDPDLLERRLGSAQSKGCIRIPASLNRLIDCYGVLDAEYKRVRYTPQATTRTTTSWPKACGTGFEMLRNCHSDETMVIAKTEAGNA